MREHRPLDGLELPGVKSILHQRSNVQVISARFTTVGKPGTVAEGVADVFPFGARESDLEQTRGSQIVITTVASVKGKGRTAMERMVHRVCLLGSKTGLRRTSKTEVIPTIDAASGTPGATVK